MIVNSIYIFQMVNPLTVIYHYGITEIIINSCLLNNRVKSCVGCLVELRRINHFKRLQTENKSPQKIKIMPIKVYSSIALMQFNQ